MTYSSKSGTWSTNYYRDFSKVASYSATVVGVRPVIMIPMSKIAKFYECSESAVRGSIYSISFALYHISEDKILLLKKIVGDKIGI